VKLAAIATPHVAGYSKQSKLLATQLALAHLQSTLRLSPLQPTPLHLFNSSPFTSSPLQLLNPFSFPSALLDDFLIYDRELRQIAELTDAGQRAASFRKLRVKYPYRDEYPNIEMPADVAEKWPFWYFLANL